LSLLKTPTSQLATNGGSQHPDKRKAGGHGPTLADEVEWLLSPTREASLLPTPTARDWRSAGLAESHHERTQAQPLSEIVHMLPTPQATSWGRFEGAIARWEEVTGRAAPAPTVPDGKNGNYRLSAVFAEWMMGLEPGHVSNPSIGINRNAQIKALGNGVVPQQAAIAFASMVKVAA
jgi:DNA (cytosine-5)-methyltransferase 1